MKNSPISQSGSTGKDRVVENGHLSMERLLDLSIAAFDDIYEGKAKISESDL